MHAGLNIFDSPSESIISLKFSYNAMLHALRAPRFVDHHKTIDRIHAM